MEVPKPLQRFFALFPLKEYPAVSPHSYPSATEKQGATLWIVPGAPSASAQANEKGPSSSSLLSRDPECLKWQAYIALRGLQSVRVRTDVDVQGALEGRLPNLHVKGKELLPAVRIPSWVDRELGEDSLKDELEGYRDVASRDESRAWIGLLEGEVHAALVGPCVFFNFSLTAHPFFSISW